MLVGFEPGHPGEPAFLVAGRPITRSHYEAVADVTDRVSARRPRPHPPPRVHGGRAHAPHGVVGRRPDDLRPLKDAQEVQFLKDNDALVNERARTAANPALNRPAFPGLLEAVQANQANRSVNTVLLRLAPGADEAAVAGEIRRWKHLEAYTRADMDEILVAKLIATSARQIFMFLVILSVVSAAIVAFIIYTMTLNKVREIAVLKLIGARNRTIAGMILQQALGLGAIGFIVGRTAARLWAPVFPKYVLLLPGDALRGVGAGDGDLRARERRGDPRGAARGPGRGDRGLGAMADSVPAIRIQGLTKRYGEGDTAVDALKGVDMTVAARRGGRPDRPQRLRQEHAPQVPRRRDRAHGGPHGARRRGDLRRGLEESPTCARCAATASASSSRRPT